MFEWIMDPSAWVALATLIALEIVLGIDNIIFISIVVERLPKSQQRRARVIGLGIAVLARILFLLSLTWIIGLTKPVFEILGNAISWRDIVMILGGLFLLGKTTFEVHHQLEMSSDEHAGRPRAVATFTGIIIQIVLLDIVFSFDSVITAIGMAQQVQVMILAVIVAIIFMIFFAELVSNFVAKYPTLKMLALGFLLLIGVALIGEGFDVHLPKGYIYFAMAFSLLVEMLNIRIHRRKRES